MIVRVEVLPWLSELVNGTIAGRAVLEEELPDGASLRTLLELLRGRHDQLSSMVYDGRGRRLTGHAEVAVNGVLYDQTGGLDSPLHDGDTVSFLPGIAGGSGHSPCSGCGRFAFPGARRVECRR
jgi:molybdopterin converting factor small subunit